MDSTSERRDNQRFKYEAIIWHNNVLPGIFYKAKLSNLSKTGVYFETDQSLYPGEKIYIAKKSDSSISNRKEFNRVEINWYDGNTEDFGPIEIKWRKELKNSSYRYGYGAIFVDSNSHLDQLIEMASVNELEKSDGRLNNKKDSRELARENYRKEIIFSSKNRTYKGTISNISRAGAFIETEDKLPLGRIVHLEISGDSFFKDLKLKGWVVRLDPKGFGVKFNRRSGSERRTDKDRRRGFDRRTRRKLNRRSKSDKFLV